METIRPKSEFKVHPAHEHEKIIKHAVKHIKGADKLLKEYADQKQKFTKRSPDNPNSVGNGLKHVWY